MNKKSQQKLQHKKWLHISNKITSYDKTNNSMIAQKFLKDKNYI
jgi:hypothetical protein